MSTKRSIKKYHPVFIVLLVGVISVFGVMLYQANRTYEYNGQQYRAGESFRDVEGCNTCSFDANGQLQCTLMACDIDGVRPDEPIDIEFSYANGAYSYSATIQKPTPCHTVESDVIVRESLPEQVDVRFVVKDSGEMCIQVIDEETVTGEILVSEAALIRVFVNDQVQAGQGVN